MNSFFQQNHAALSAFARISNAVGARADYVQGGGGNTSVKLPGGLMAIKASGFCLKDVTPENAYAVLDFQALRDFYGSSSPEAFEDVEKAGSAKAKESIRAVEGLPALRPSVEAGFHSILDTYVAHSHSAYANLAACAMECRDLAQAALGDAGYGFAIVPYADPGARLTFSIRDEMARVEAATGRRPAVILLQNHGIIAHADDPDECLRIHEDANARFARLFNLAAADFPAVSVAPAGDGLLEAQCDFLADQIRSGAVDERFFLETPLYPDQMVFLIGTFAYGDGIPDEGKCLASAATGRILFRMPEAKARVIAETLAAVAFIADVLRRNGKTLATMGEAAQKFIANWESEKYRKSLSGTTNH